MDVERPLCLPGGLREDLVGKDVEAGERVRTRPLWGVQRLPNLESPVGPSYYIGHTH